jgi:valyl-tRNA synthetase
MSLQVSPWPEPQDWIDETAEKRGDMIIGVISAIRREKAERHVSLNTQIKKLTVYVKDKETGDAIKSGSGDIIGACKVENLEVNVGKDTGREVNDCPNLSFTTEY